MASKECVVDLTRSSKVPSSAPLQVFPRMTAKLVPKILGYNLHVLEDEDIINQVVGKRNFGGPPASMGALASKTRYNTFSFLFFFTFHSLFSLISSAIEHTCKSTCYLSHLKIWYPFVGDCAWFGMQ
jgi:hypothetical protein